MKKIAIPSWNAFLLHEVEAREDTSLGFPLSAELYLPSKGEGPFPAVVVAQGLGGPKDARERRYARMLADHGYVAIVIESFTSRGWGRSHDTIRALRVSETMMLGDTFASLRYLAEREDVDAGNISVIGFSYGGMIAYLAAFEQLAGHFLPNGPRFASHVCYYPCTVPRLDDVRTTGAPVTMLLGELDANVNIERCREIANDLRAGGSRVDMTVFPSIYHQWDGIDVERRFVRWHLSNSKMRIGEDLRVRDERTGLRMNGLASRTSMLALSASPSGYYIKQDIDTTRRTDAMLLAAVSAGSGALPFAAQPPLRRPIDAALPLPSRGGAPGLFGATAELGSAVHDPER